MKYNRGDIIDRNGNKWRWDPKEKHFHKESKGGGYGNYKNVDPDGQVSHPGRSILDTLVIILPQNKKEVIIA